MIYTVTLNPSLDYIVSVEDFQLGRTNRTDSELLLPGGKGINVSMVLKNLGLDSTALGFTAGFTGRAIAEMLADMGVHTGFIHSNEGLSRINFKLKNIEGTEVNGRGPAVGADKLSLLMERFEAVGEGDVLVLAGSIPSSVPEDIYSGILEKVQGSGMLAVVDAAGDLLVNALAYRPFLVKPNNYELGELFGVRLATREEVVPYGRKLQKMGARNVLVSMAGAGAVLVAEDGGIYGAPAPEGTLVNSVGAGDSMVAGFLFGWLSRQDYGYAFRMGVAAGSASAFSERLAAREEILAVYERVQIV